MASPLAKYLTKILAKEGDLLGLSLGASVEDVLQSKRVRFTKRPTHDGFNFEIAGDIERGGWVSATVKSKLVTTLAAQLFTESAAEAEACHAAVLTCSEKRFGTMASEARVHGSRFRTSAGKTVATTMRTYERDGAVAHVHVRTDPGRSYASVASTACVYVDVVSSNRARSGKAARG